MKNLSIIRPTLFVVFFALSISPFDAIARTLADNPIVAPVHQSQFKEFYKKISSIDLVPVRDAKILWLWITKKIRREPIGAQLQRKATKAFRRTALPVAAVLTIATAILGGKLYLDYKRKKDRLAEQQRLAWLKAQREFVNQIKEDFSKETKRKEEYERKTDTEKLVALELEEKNIVNKLKEAREKGVFSQQERLAMKSRLGAIRNEKEKLRKQLFEKVEAEQVRQTPLSGAQKLSNSGRGLTEDQLVSVVAQGYNLSDQDAARVLAHFKALPDVKTEDDLLKKIDEDSKIQDSLLQQTTPGANVYRPEIYQALTKLGSHNWIVTPIPMGGYFFFQYGSTVKNLPLKNIISLKESSSERYLPELTKLVSEYKIHLMNKAEDTNKIMALLLQDPVIVQNTNNMKLQARRVASDDREFPYVVIYVRSKDKAQNILNRLCLILSSFKGDGNNLTYNQKVNDLIWFAQGNRDEKQEMYKDYYADDRIYYSPELNKEGGNEDYMLKIPSGC